MATWSESVWSGFFSDDVGCCCLEESRTVRERPDRPDAAVRGLMKRVDDVPEGFARGYWISGANTTTGNVDHVLSGFRINRRPFLFVLTQRVGRHLTNIIFCYFFNLIFLPPIFSITSFIYLCEHVERYVGIFRTWWRYKIMEKVNKFTYVTIVISQHNSLVNEASRIYRRIFFEW